MTALRNACTDTDTVLDIDSALDIDTYPKPYTIDSEVVNVVGGGHALSVTVERGAGGSTAAAHVNGSTLTAANAFSGGGGSQTLAEVLVEGNVITPGSDSVPSIAAASPNAGIWVGTAIVDQGQTVQLVGGDGPDAGGAAVLGGGAGTDVGSTGAFVSTDPGVTSGGNVQIGGGDAGPGAAGQGGDIVVTTGTGDGAGRNGLVFLNLPTSDPAVAGALWNNGGTVKVSS